jgi:GNAT superfamily N-acetyltransferase
VIKINSIEMEPNHLAFFSEIIKESPIWKETELKDLTLEEYINGYTTMRGNWEVWLADRKPVGITFTVERAPSNHKMWLGTILILKEHRNKGYARNILSEIASRAFSRGEEAIFCGVPIEINEWSMFLSKCGFEQFKIEKDESGQNYLLLVNPLS